MKNIEYFAYYWKAGQTVSNRYLKRITINKVLRHCLYAIIAEALHIRYGYGCGWRETYYYQKNTIHYSRDNYSGWSRLPAKLDSKKKQGDCITNNPAVSYVSYI